MDVAEEDIARQIEQIPGMAPEMRPGFDQLGADDPQKQGRDACFRREVVAARPVVEVSPGQIEQGRVDDQSEVEQRCDVYGVDAPPLCSPDLARAQAAWIASPGRTRPSHALR